MQGLVLVVVLALTVVVGTTLGRRWSVAPPVLLILLGAALGMLPGLDDVTLEPDYVLLLFLPAILYWESVNTSLREVRANLRVIILSAVALVVVTMVTVSYAAQALGVDSRAAWVLGAVLAPTDAAAVAGLAKRMPRRTLTTLHAESLINDGTALVLYSVAVSALSGHAPGPAALVGMFAWSSVAGVAVGLLAAAVVIPVRTRVEDPLRDGALSVLTPFTAFLLAEFAHASGVLAVVVAGLTFAHWSPTVIGARSRINTTAFWNLSTFLINGSLFVLVGLEIPQAVAALSSVNRTRALGIALAVTAVVILTRLLWVHASAMAIRAVDRRAVQRTRRVSWRVRTASGWAGFRGAVSLAAALAVPATAGGEAFTDRDLIIFVTSLVILATLLIQGPTLPAVVRWAGLVGDDARTAEVRRARLLTTQAGLRALPEVARDVDADPETVARVRSEYQARLDALQASDDADEVALRYRGAEQELRLRVLQRKRQAATDLRNADEIDDLVLRELQTALDIEEIRLLGEPLSEDA